MCITVAFEMHAWRAKFNSVDSNKAIMWLLFVLPSKAACLYKLRLLLLKL